MLAFLDAGGLGSLAGKTVRVRVGVADRRGGVRDPGMVVEQETLSNSKAPSRAALVELGKKLVELVFHGYFSLK